MTIATTSGPHAALVDCPLDVHAAATASRCLAVGMEASFKLLYIRHARPFVERVTRTIRLVRICLLDGPVGRAAPRCTTVGGGDEPRVELTGGNGAHSVGVVIGHRERSIGPAVDLSTARPGMMWADSGQSWRRLLCRWALNRTPDQRLRRPPDSTRQRPLGAGGRPDHRSQLPRRQREWLPQSPQGLEHESCYG
jgi:hypothetical protein